MSTWVTGTTVTESSTSVENNTSSVTINLIVGWNGGSWAADSPRYYIQVNGTTVKSGTANFNTGQSSTGSQLIATWTGNVAHNDDGSGSMTWAVGYEGIYAYEGNYSTASGTKILTTIARKSLFGTLTNKSIEGSISFPITKRISGATDTLVITSGSFSKTISNYTNNQNFTFTTAEKNQLYALNTSGTSVPLTLTLTTVYNNQTIGSDTKSIQGTWTAANPTFAGTISTSPATIYSGHSTLTVSLSQAASGTKAATISQYSVTVGSTTKTSSAYTGPFVFDRPTTNSITLVVTDSRGKQCTNTQTYTLTPFYQPTLTGLTANRTPLTTSTSAALAFAGLYNANGGVPAASYKVKPKGGSWGSATSLALTTSETGSDGEYSFSGTLSDTFTSTSEYVIQVTVTQSNPGVTLISETTLPSASVTVDIDTDGHRVGVAQFLSNEANDSLSVKGDIYEKGTKLEVKYVMYEVVQNL